MSDVQEVQAGVQRVDAGSLVHFGPIVNGALIPFASVRQGDYDEAVAAGAQVAPVAPADSAQVAQAEPAEPAQVAPVAPADPAPEG